MEMFCESAEWCQFLENEVPERGGSLLQVSPPPISIPDQLVCATEQLAVVQTREGRCVTSFSAPPRYLQLVMGSLLDGVEHLPNYGEII
jgi:hypothetical protein